MLHSKAAPTENSERIPSLDFLRGIAILGILFINIENFAYPDSWSPWRYGFNNEMDHTVRFWVYFLTQGKFYSMFALLFGAGFYIFLERLHGRGLGSQAMDIYARRLLWLFVIGVVHAYLIWSGDILYHYAVCGFLLIPFRSIKTRDLVLIVVLLSGLLLIRSCDQTKRRQGWHETAEAALRVPESQRTAEQTKKIEFWNDLTTRRGPDTTAVPAMHQNYRAVLQQNYEHVDAHKGALYNQGLLFSTLILMILGIILYRSGIFGDYRVWKHYWTVCLSILSLGLIINFIRYYHWTYSYFDPVLNIWQAWIFTFPRELLGVGYVLIFNGLYQKYFVTIKLKLVTNVGRTALTNYILQSTLLGLLFYEYGMSWYNRFSRAELPGIVLGIWVVQLFLTWIWLRIYQQGPLEWIWRKLTYGAFDRLN